MSHVVVVKTEIRDGNAVAAACRRLGIETPHHGVAQLYERDVEGLIVKLPNWRYPVVVNLESGEVAKDDYGGNWGAPAVLQEFFQAYAIEKAKLEARRAGHTVTEQPLHDGSVKLTIQVGGEA